jgi:hypothetical protein
MNTSLYIIIEYIALFCGTIHKKTGTQKLFTGELVAPTKQAVIKQDVWCNQKLTYQGG